MFMYLHLRQYLVQFKVVVDKYKMAGSFSAFP